MSRSGILVYRKIVLKRSIVTFRIICWIISRLHQSGVALLNRTYPSIIRLRVNPPQVSSNRPGNIWIQQTWLLVLFDNTVLCIACKNICWYKENMSLNFRSSFLLSIYNSSLSSTSINDTQHFIRLNNVAVTTITFYHLLLQLHCRLFKPLSLVLPF